MKYSFDQYILKLWPIDVPQDCSNLFEYKDCLERDLSVLDWCESCRVYAGLSQQYYETNGGDIND